MTQKNRKEIYTYTVQEVTAEFHTSEHRGLTTAEAYLRLKQYGRNQLAQKRNWKWLKLIVNQFKDALVWILIVAATLAFFFGETRDVVIILFIVGINALIGFLQEFKAERILDSITKLTTDQSQVVRDGKKQEIDARLLVPGDVVFVAAGDRAPADGFLIESYDLKVNSFIFTGESKPETKSVKTLSGDHVALADIDNMLFMGETVATGEARYIVTGTGMQTELGRIAHLTGEIKEAPTPMQKQMQRLSKNITITAVSIGTCVMIIGQYSDTSVYDSFLFALALAVSVVPEGLPAAISVALSLGMKRLLKVKVLAKKLSAVETLGSVSIICTDKTGTITKNELTVTHIVINDHMLTVSGTGYSSEGHFYHDEKAVNPSQIKNLEMLCRIGALCNDANIVLKDGVRTVVGDPTEGAIIVAGEKYNPKENYFSIGETKITENPFSSDRMRMSVVYKNDHVRSFVKGSPDVMIDLCEFVVQDGDIVLFTPEKKQHIKEMYNMMSAEALRVLGFAYRELNDVDAKNYLEEAEKKLIWVGMMAMIDPPRADVAQAVAECKDLGIKVIMITGDYEITAKAIARNIGLIGSEGTYDVINGKTLHELSDREVYRRIMKGDVVFARIAPEQKLRIATILHDHHQVIAMTGDGVNDAPALKKAEVGVAMGVIGTDVSKEASDMILMDDRFASIVDGVKEGRTIYHNLRKFVHYVFTSNVSELFTVIIGVVMHIPSPITAIQILAIDLATDIFPSFSLSLEPAEPHHAAKIANSKESIISWSGVGRLVYLGGIMAVGAASAFYWSMIRSGWSYGQPYDVDSEMYMMATTAAYAVLAMTQMANLIQSRSETLSPFALGFFKNKYAIVSIVISFGMLLMFMYVSFFQAYLGMRPILWQDWLVVGIATFMVYVAENIRKVWFVK